MVIMIILPTKTKNSYDYKNRNTSEGMVRQNEW